MISSPKPFQPGISWCVLLILAGCGQSRPNAHLAQSDVAGSPATVRATVLQPQRKSLVRIVELPGRVAAYEVTPIHAKATGYVIKVPVDVGDRIHGPQKSGPGTLLCELQVPELKEELAQKTAAIRQVDAEVLQAEANIKVAQAALRSARAKVTEAKAAVEREESLYVRWQSEFERITQLSESGAVTRKVADEARAQRDAADAGRSEVAAHIVSVEAEEQQVAADLEKAKADAVAASARLAVAQADERRIAAMLDYCFVRAPFDGIVVERNVHTGHLIQAGGASSKPLLVVMRTDPVRVLIDVPEVDAVHVNSETKVEIKIPSLPGSQYVGTITRSSWSLNSNSRTMSAEIHLPNAEGTWRPGQYVQARLTAATVENCLSIPKSAVVTQDKQTYCITVDDEGKVGRQQVSLGLSAGDEVEVRQGLSGQEQIISKNPNAYREGQIVAISEPKNS